MNSARPQFPMWIFIATDLALLGAAAVIALQAPKPFSQSTILWIVACAILGVVVGLVPLIWHYERQKNEALDDRQRALEALARTIGSSADQISIATGGLHEITELAHKNLRQAEQLPQRLQEKIAEFQAQLLQANDTEKEELERELLALRTSESERLDAVSQRIAKATAEWGKLETATAQQLAAASDGLARLSVGTAEAIGQAQAATEKALAQVRIEAARTLGDAGGQAVKDIEAARAAALTGIAATLTHLINQVADDAATRVAARLASSTARLEEKLQQLEQEPPASLPPTPSHAPSAAPQSLSSSIGAEGNLARVSTPAPEIDSPVADAPARVEPVAPTEPQAHPPAQPAAEVQAAAPSVKRPRKPRHVESAAPGPDANAAPANGSSDGSAPPAAVAANNERIGVSSPETINGEAAHTSVAISPVVVGSASGSKGVVAPITEVAPVVPVAPASYAAAVETPSAPLTQPAATADDADAARPAARKRSGKKGAEEDTPALDLGLDEVDFNDARRDAMAGSMERVLTSDGATRLLVTAYIGIGNRLYIRGEGPGLSWDKGIPLEFISIGKWRWHTNEAAQPVQFKIYKNDELECGSLGRQSVEPGYQQEFTAAF